MLTRETLRRSIRTRLTRLTEACASEESMARARLEARRDVVEFCRSWVWTYDPRLGAKGLPVFIPFEPFDFQVELIEWFVHLFRELGEDEERQDGLVEKSRDMGFTWTFCAWLVWMWLFNPGFAGGVGSRQERYVDRLGDLDAILPKCRFIIERLPPFLRPQDDRGRFWSSRIKEHSKKMQIVNPENGATISGEGGDEIGRGGRKTVYFVDEHASVRRADMVDAALSMNTDLRIYGSSSKGPGNLFYRKRMSGHLDVMRLHWTSDPRKDAAWYAEQVRKFATTPWIVPQEIDIDYMASITGGCIPTKYLEACAKWEAPADLVELYPVVVGFDVADGGGDANAAAYNQGPRLRFLGGGVWREGTAFQAASHLIHLLMMGSTQADHILYDAIGIGTQVREFFTLAQDGDPSGVAQGIDTSAVQSYMEQVDVHPYVASGAASDYVFGDTERTAKQICRNARAESWWRFREAARKTYEVVEGIAHHDPAECLDLDPDDLELRLQLATPKYHTSQGLVVIESKDDMGRRGVSSPDRADAAVMARSLDQIAMTVGFGGVW